MWSVLEDTFIETGLPYSRQGSYGEDDKLPESFFTFWQTRCEPGNYYCNRATQMNYEWAVFYYSSNPETLYTGLENFIRIAEDKGFQLQSIQDVTCDEPTYFGRYCKIVYTEQLN